MSDNFTFDFDYQFSPDYSPRGCDVRPWFLMTDPGYSPSDDYWVYALRYRPEKIAFVREQIRGVDRPAALRKIMQRVWNGATSDRQRHERLIQFIERMMVHPPVEQPLEADAVKSLRRDCCEPTDHGQPYPEDLQEPWAQAAFEEAKAYGRHLGIWCSRIGQKLAGDWGLRGVVNDALELLSLHEGRCGHQAMVFVQLAQAGGMRARLVQGVHHRYSELLVDGKWVLGDTDMFARGFIPKTPEGELPTIEWCRDHPESVNAWPTLENYPKGAAVHYGARRREIEMNQPTRAMIKDLRLSPSLWEDGGFPTMEQYRTVLSRGRMLYSLDLVDADLPGPVGPAVAERPCNLLYHNGGSGFDKGKGGGFGTPGFGRNEWLLDGVAEQRDYIASIHARGIPVLIYQSDNNFDRTVFSADETAGFAAELDPFACAFGTEGRTFACINKPAWREYLAARLEIRIGRYGADGAFLDNCTPFIHCRCETCRRLYRERFGQSADVIADIGRPETVVADMRVFDYAYGRTAPKNLARIDDRDFMRYLEWRIERIIDFYRDLRERTQRLCRRPVIWTTNGHVAIPEFTGLYLAGVTDMIFSEEGYSAPPVSNAFALRLGTAIGRGERCMLVLTRVLESAPTADMVSVFSAEGRALGGQATFWDFHLRADERLAAAERTMREFFIEHADDLFTIERDANDTAILMSYRSDLWTGQSTSPARHVADLLEDLNQPFDLLLPERADALDRLGDYTLIIAPHTEILSTAWLDVLQRYLDHGGRLISTGNTAALDENLAPRQKRWTSNRWRHFDDRVEKQFAESRKAVGVHHAFAGPAGAFADAIREALAQASLIVDPPQPLLAVNHTALPDGEAIHLVNRHVNLFTRIRLRRREGLTVRLKPRRKIDNVQWLSSGQAPLPLEIKQVTGEVIFPLPPLEAYGVIRVFYAR